MKRRNGFTLIELAVAVGLLAVVLMIGSSIFRVSIDSQRMAVANMEVMQKFRAITDQLNADFQGLRKDGEIYAVWVAIADANQPDGFARMDRIVFFAEGDFQSYGSDFVGKSNNAPVRGNLARICYMLARNEQDELPEDQDPEKRMLARTQHILTADADLNDLPSLIDLALWDDLDWVEWINDKEYDRISLDGWKAIRVLDKVDLLARIADEYTNDPVERSLRGAKIDRRNPFRIHMLLSEGVSRFEVQGWSNAQMRWVPEVDPDGDGSATDSDLPVDGDRLGGRLLYPYNADDPDFPQPLLSIGGSLPAYPDPNDIIQARFNDIAGLGRALKFTFTIYDSKGVLKKGRTFTHIVHLDN